MTAPHSPSPHCAGTQVVTRVDVHGTNGVRQHPSGAVGIVTRTPAGAEVHYLVRFPDGFEARLLAGELETLRNFQERLGPSLGASQAPPSFELEPHVIYRCVMGSRAYGLDTDDSDTDLRGVYVAPADMQWSLYGAPEQIEDSAAQTCVWEMQKFIVMALKANPNVHECLYSPLVEKVTPLGAELIGLRDRFLSRMIFQTFNGYALSQFKKLEQDQRTQGVYRWKHAMHLLRLLITGARTLREGRIPVRVEHDRDRLLAVKRGEVPWSEVAEWRRRLHGDFENALASSSLPERPDYEAANDFLLRARRAVAAGAR